MKFVYAVVLVGIWGYISVAADKEKVFQFSALANLDVPKILAKNSDQQRALRGTISDLDLKARDDKKPDLVSSNSTPKSEKELKVEHGALTKRASYASSDSQPGLDVANLPPAGDPIGSVANPNVPEFRKAIAKGFAIKKEKMLKIAAVRRTISEFSSSGSNFSEPKEGPMSARFRNNSDKERGSESAKDDSPAMQLAVATSPLDRLRQFDSELEQKKKSEVAQAYNAPAYVAQEQDILLPGQIPESFPVKPAEPLTIVTGSSSQGIVLASPTEQIPTDSSNGSSSGPTPQHLDSPTTGKVAGQTGTPPAPCCFGLC